MASVILNKAIQKEWLAQTEVLDFTGSSQTEVLLSENQERDRKWKLTSQFSLKFSFQEKLYIAGPFFAPFFAWVFIHQNLQHMYYTDFGLNFD